MDKGWRPEDWKNPYHNYEPLSAEEWAFEKGVSAIIPVVREATLKEVGEWLSKNPHLLSWFELAALRQGKMPGEVK